MDTAPAATLFTTLHDLPRALADQASGPVAMLASTAAGAPHAPQAPGGLGEGLSLTIVGMAVVFGALALLWLIIDAAVRLTQRRAAEGPAPAPALAKTPAAARAEPEVQPGIDPETTAIIAAAAAAAVGLPVRLRRIGLAQRGGTSAWVATGRSQVMGSHRPRHRH